MEKNSDLVSGMFFREKKDYDKDFVLGRLSIKVAEFIPWLRERKDEEWLNLDILQSKAGKPYVKLNTWKPPQKEEEKDSDIPF